MDIIEVRALPVRPGRGRGRGAYVIFVHALCAALQPLQSLHLSTLYVIMVSPGARREE